MNLQKIKRLTKAINELEKQLQMERNRVLEHFENLSPEDMALGEGIIREEGIEIRYIPSTITQRVDTAKMKKDNIYDNYLTSSTRSSYIKVKIEGEG